MGDQEDGERLYEDYRFNKQFNETDSEVLLRDILGNFEKEKVRMDLGHKRAESPLKFSE